RQMVRIDPIAQSGAAFVEHDEAAEGSQPAQELGVSRILPVDIEIGDKAGNEDQIDRSVAYDLVGDANVSAASVMGRRLRQRPALPNPDLTTLGAQLLALSALGSTGIVC